MRRPARIAAMLAAGLIIPTAPIIAQHADHGAHQARQSADPLSAAVAAPNRTPTNIARDKYRHPAETLAFFGVSPTQTVVEYAPSGGWYSEILAPLLRDKGTFYALQPSGRYMDGYKAFLAAKPDVYAQVKVAAFPEEADTIPADSVDTLLTFRNVHNLVMNGAEASTFRTFYRLLKPGGTLGVVEHRLPEDRDSALEKTSGYIKMSTIRRIAEAAGFEFVGSSEINANPKDTANWEKGVWTLPPTLRNGAIDRDRYIAIGESDRMTMKFRKPLK